MIEATGLRLERGTKVHWSNPWTGGKHKIVLGDPRIHVDSITRAKLPVPSETPLDAAWLQAGATIFSTVRLPDQAYKAILREAERRGIPAKREVVSIPKKGPPVFYLRITIG